MNKENSNKLFLNKRGKGNDKVRCLAGPHNPTWQLRGVLKSNFVLPLSSFFLSFFVFGMALFLLLFFGQPSFFFQSIITHPFHLFIYWSLKYLYSNLKFIWIKYGNICRHREKTISPIEIIILLLWRNKLIWRNTYLHSQISELRLFNFNALNSSIHLLLWYKKNHFII